MLWGMSVRLSLFPLRANTQTTPGASRRGAGGRRPAAAAALAVAVLVGSVAALPACVPGAPAPPAASTAVRDANVMRAPRVTPAQMAAWFRSKTNNASGWRASVNLNTMTRLFIEEGRREGVAGDLAFIQAIVETGWFRFGGAVPGNANNFGGIGAVDSAPQRFNRFPTARLGVRGQIHHLRAYADPRVTPQRLSRPLASPRFHLVVPKGKAPRWSVMGRGNWATDPQYGMKILRLYGEMLRHAGVPNPGPVVR